MVGFLMRDAEPVTSLMKFHLLLNRSSMNFRVGNLVEVKDSRGIVSPVIRHVRMVR
jgi:hypothetical protein